MDRAVIAKNNRRTVSGVDVPQRPRRPVEEAVEQRGITVRSRRIVRLDIHDLKSVSLRTGIANDQRQAVIGEGNEIEANATEGPNLAAPPAAVKLAGVAAGTLHKPLLHMAGMHPILANVKHHIFGRHFPNLHWKVGSGRAKIDRVGPICVLKEHFSRDVENAAPVPTRV